MSRLRDTFRWSALVLVAALLMTYSARAAMIVEPTVEELKARLSSASAGDKPRICVQIAEKQLVETNKLYAEAEPEPEKSQAALTDVVTYSEMARDYAIQSHRHEKQTEIAVRGMARKLTGIMHGLPHDEQAAVKDAITRLERVRDTLLAAMFPKGAK